MNLIKKVTISALILIVISYASFIFLAPQIIDVNKNKPAIKQLVVDNLRLKIDFSNASIFFTPLLGVGLKFDNFRVNYIGDFKFATAKEAVFEISMPNLLLKEIKFNKIAFESPTVNYIILPSGQASIDFYFDDNLNLSFIPSTKTFLEEYTIIPSSVILNNYTIGRATLADKGYRVFSGKELILEKNKVASYMKAKAKGQARIK